MQRASLDPITGNNNIDLAFLKTDLQNEIGKT